MSDGGAADTSGAVGGATESAGTDEVADLTAKFAAFCEVKTKNQFTPKACNKLVKDCFDGHYKFKNVILTNRVDSSVFSRCKEKSKPYMIVTSGNCEKFLQFTAHEFAKLKYMIVTSGNCEKFLQFTTHEFAKLKYMIVTSGNCEKFLQFTAHEFAKLKKNNDKLAKDDPVVKEMYGGLKDKVLASTGPRIKSVKPSATGNVSGLTDTSKYTGSHKLRFDESGKGRGKVGRVDQPSKSGYVEAYKGEGTFEEGEKEES